MQLSIGCHSYPSTAAPGLSQAEQRALLQEAVTRLVLQDQVLNYGTTPETIDPLIGPAYSTVFNNPAVAKMLFS